MNTPDSSYEPNSPDPAQSMANIRNSSFEKKESSEVIPYLRVTVTGEHLTTQGQYVGLTKIQRQALKVNIGDAIEVFSDKQVFLGRYTVSLGLKIHKQFPNLCTANNIPPQTTVLIIKMRGKSQY